MLLSAKLNLATARNLAAGHIAEIVGGAIALNLLFEIALCRAAVITGAVAFGLLAFQNRGYRRSSGSSRVC